MTLNPNWTQMDNNMTATLTQPGRVRGPIKNIDPVEDSMPMMDLSKKIGISIADIQRVIDLHTVQTGYPKTGMELWKEITIICWAVDNDLIDSPLQQRMDHYRQQQQAEYDRTHPRPGRPPFHYTPTYADRCEEALLTRADRYYTL